MRRNFLALLAHMVQIQPRRQKLLLALFALRAIFAPEEPQVLPTRALQATFVQLELELERDLHVHLGHTLVLEVYSIHHNASTAQLGITARTERMGKLQLLLYHAPLVHTIRTLKAGMFLIVYPALLVSHAREPDR